MDRILVVEDTPETQKVIQAALGSQFYTHVASTLSDARSQMARTHFDLVLLDVVLPDGDGMLLCSEWRQLESTRATPVIFLSGRADVDAKVLGLSLGADDYITKPFAPAELKARVERTLRKTREAPHTDSGTFSIPGLVCHFATQRISMKHEGIESSVELPSIEFRLLLHLARSENHYFSRHDLLKAVWGPDVRVVERAVDVHICNLRKKIENSPYAIKAIHRVGYAFIRKDSE